MLFNFLIVKIKVELPGILLTQNSNIVRKKRIKERHTGELLLSTMTICYRAKKSYKLHNEKKTNNILDIYLTQKIKFFVIPCVFKKSV